MSLISLAESIILQALEDLDHPAHRAESLDFFHGYRFRLFARMAHMSRKDVVELRGYTKKHASPFCEQEKPTSADRKMLKGIARASLRYKQPLFMHLMGRC